MRPRPRQAATHRLIGTTPGIVALVVALASPAVAIGVIQGHDGKIAFESDRAGSADVWITRTSFLGPPVAQAWPMAGNSAARDGRPAWAPPPVVKPIDAFRQPEDPTDVARFFIEERQPGWQITVRWPGLAGEHAVQPTADPRIVQATAPTAAQSGRPCISIREKAVVRDWPARALAGEITIGSTPVNTDTQDICDQPLAFQSDRAGRWDIWLYDPMTGALRNATADAPASDETAPTWSSQLGTEFDETRPRANPVLAFVSNRTGKGDVFVLDPLAPEGTPALNVTNTPADDEANPDWSPDGTWLTFERDRDGDRQLWVMRVDPVTNLPGVARRVTSDLGPSTEPSWFTWGQAGEPEPTDEIAFDGSGPDGDYELHDVEAPEAANPFGDMSLVTQWTMPGSSANERHPSWSPRGDVLVFASDRSEAAGDAAGDFNLWARLSQNDGDEWLVTSGAANDVHPSWQPLYIEASVDPRRPRGRATPRKKGRISVVVTPTPTPSPTPTPTPTPEPESDCTMTGTPGLDVMLGTPGDDVLCGGAGADRFAGRGGDDVIVGGAGDDRISGGGGDDQLRGGAGRDRLAGDGGADRLVGGAGPDRLSGGLGADVLLGGAGADWLAGGPGRDRVKGGGGRDQSVADRRDTLTQTERIRRP